MHYMYACVYVYMYVYENETNWDMHLNTKGN